MLWKRRSGSKFPVDARASQIPADLCVGIRYCQKFFAVFPVLCDVCICQETRTQETRTTDRHLERPLPTLGDAPE
jgi:hypothetical protein